MKVRSFSSPSSKPQQAFGLVETLLVLGAVSALSLGIYMVFKPASAVAQTKSEQDNLNQLSNAVERSLGLVGTFEGLSASRIVSDRLAPEKMTRSGSLSTAWGAPVSVASATVRSANDAFVVTYPSTPSDVCARLASAVSSSTYDIRVNGTSVFSDGRIDVNRVATNCARSSASQMEFVYHSGLVAGTAVAAPPLTLPPSNPAVMPPSSPPVGGAVGPVGPVGPANPVGPVTSPPASSTPAPAPVAPPSVTPVSPTTPAVVTPPAAVTPPTTAVVACSPRPNTNETQQLNCGSGQYGTVWQSRYATWSCPEAWEASVQGPFSAWTTTSNSCANCPAPSTQSQNQWVATSGACPAGQAGTRTWQRQQVSTRSVSYNCPAGTQTLPAPTYGGWSGWSDTGATQNAGGTCTTCPAPWTQSQTQWVQTSAGCPAGQNGSHTWEREQVAYRTVSYNCPAGTASVPGPSYGPWGGWGDTGARRGEVNSCAPAGNWNWYTDVIYESSSGTQEDRTQYTVTNASGVENFPRKCFWFPSNSSGYNGSVWTWRGSGWAPQLTNFNDPDCACNPSRAGYTYEWYQSEYFASETGFRTICEAR